MASRRPAGPFRVACAPATDAAGRARPVTENQRIEPQPQARKRRSWWPGWIWSVPIAALLIVGYLAVQQLTSRGPSVSVTFPTGGAIKPSDTQVRYQGLQVGQVESVKLQKDLRHVDV